MSNTYFEFKQFRIDQRNSAMKVNTDSVMLGAWADASNAGTALDIGTGTGLLALMMAQKSQAQIHAIDIAPGACHDARDNFARSPWPQRLSVQEADFSNYWRDCPARYDLVISNPPYFNDSLKAAGHDKTRARHTDALPHSTLLRGTSKILGENGRLFVVLPYERHTRFVAEAREHGLHYTAGLACKPSPGKAPNRVLMRFDTTDGPTTESELTIRTSQDTYTREYLYLTRDYYKFA